jgi:PTS system cellobiose-specific IIB component
MKVLLLCAGGYSTSILMRKMEKYAQTRAIPLEISAASIMDYPRLAPGFDILLLAPQISYKKAEVAEVTGMPVLVVEQMDYAIGNAEHIFSQIHERAPHI